MSRERISDWEADEIEHEIRCGAKPENVAFQHGFALRDVLALMRRRGLVERAEQHQWTQAETLFVRDNYPQHGPDWPVWRDVLPDMSWVNIKAKAQKMGVRAIMGTRRNDWREDA